ncbi:hypothetical protein B0T24DRAFT_523708 [Lasiosphaeria ovina]|uniref:Uncharacterized protein n=1 Tax=Lasiosphaeria ovina TaxID=92902 RepID=A0AAE0NAI8_9PEZI|nr:hypothetical protein B0T24DRAFT_523708 [Lasiosphaeria ovina]
MDVSIQTAEHNQSDVANWKPWYYRPLFLAILITLQLLYIGVLELLIRKYRNATPEGASLKSTLYRNSIFVYRVNDYPTYSAWQHAASVFALCNSLLWEMVYGGVHRLEPFHQLTKPQGASVAESLALDYSNDLAFWVPIKAILNGHWAVLTASLGHLLATIGTPALTRFAWSTGMQEDALLTIIHEPYIRALQGLNAIVAALGALLIVFSVTRRSGLLADVATIEDAARLIADSPILPLLKQIPSYERIKAIQTSLSHLRFCLRHVPKNYRGVGPALSAELDLVQTDSSQDTPLTIKSTPSRHVYKKSRLEAHPFGLWGRAISLWIIFSFLENGFFRADWGFDASALLLWVRVDISIYLIFSEALQNSMAVIQPFFCLTPFRLRRRRLPSPRPRTAIQLRVTPSATLPLLAQSAYQRLIPILLVITTMTFATQIMNIALLPMLEIVVTNHAYGFSTSNTFARTNLSIIVISLTIGVVSTLNLYYIIHSRRCWVFMPRKPTSLLSRLMYLCNSETLLAEVRANAPPSGVDEKQAAGRYSFGWFREHENDCEEGGEGSWFIGVERRRALAIQYRYGATEPSAEDIELWKYLRRQFDGESEAVQRRGTSVVEQNPPTPPS